MTIFICGLLMSHKSPEIWKNYMREWRAKHPEYKKRERENVRRWLLNHPEARKRYDEEYRMRPEVKIRLKKWQKEHREQHTIYCREWRKILKLKLIEMLGGKCQKCGYNKYFGALDFHHKTGEKEKVWEWRTKKFIDKIKADKIQLLCSNCHREIHAKEE